MAQHVLGLPHAPLRRNPSALPRRASRLSSMQAGEPPPESNAFDDVVSRMSKLEVAGFILAVVLPVFGFIIGVVLVNRPEKQTVRHGLWMISISVVIGFLFFVTLIAYSHSTGAQAEGG